MNETFYKNSISGMHLCSSIVMMVGCIVFGILYGGDTVVKVAVPVIGIVFTAIWMFHSYNKYEMYKRIKVTDTYIEIVSRFKIGYRIDFEEVGAVGKLGMALTKSSTEKFFISTMPLSKTKQIDLSNTITFDATAKTRAVMRRLADKYGWEIVELNS